VSNSSPSISEVLIRQHSKTILAVSPAGLMLCLALSGKRQSCRPAPEAGSRLHYLESLVQLG